jgi:flagellar basal-body rod modification protein FlgD
MATSVSPISGSSAAADAGASSAASLTGSSAPTQQMFLQLLVAQIKNQDPLNPTDSVQFVSQLAQFSELEQVIAIRGDLDAQQTAAAAATQSNNNG